MSKIDEALQEIKHYLSSNDHSDNPQIRQAASVYAKACKEINSKLADCRQLIDRGLLIDAQKIDMEMQPTLTERAEMLQLPSKIYHQYQEICRLYGYDNAPAIDSASLDRLRQTPDGKEELLKELILRWRKIARTGSNLEKIKLLRSIIKCAPADDKIWRSNLVSVERQWVSDLMKEAQKAIETDEGEKLAQIYMALTDPQLQQPLSGSELHKIQPHVRKYQQKSYLAELEKRRKELFAAYSALNLDLIAERLRTYDTFITNPLYEYDAEAEQAVAEVRNYLQQQIEKANTEKFYQEKLAELNALLEQHGDFAVIENIYGMLQKTDIPLDKRISMRVEFRRQEFLAESGRRHLRKCIYGVLGSLLLAALIFLIFLVVQHTRTYFTHNKSMQTLLANGNYEGVIKLHEKIKKESPMLLQFGKLTAMQLEAEKALAQQNERQKQVVDQLNSADLLFMQKNPPVAELLRIKKSLDELVNFELPAELADRRRKMEFMLRRLEFNLQQQLDKDFMAQHAKCMRTLEALDSAMLNADSDLASIGKKIAGTMQFMQQLTDNSTKVNAQMRARSNNMVQSQGKLMLENLKNIDKRRTLVAALTRPKSFIQYSDAMQKLPLEAPDLANRSWQSALKNFPRYQALAAGSNLSIFTAYDELEKAVSELQINMNDNCFVKDISRLLPDKFFKERVASATKQLTTELGAVYDCYELAFVDEKNIRWYFYSAEKPMLDKSRSSRTPKAIALNVMLVPGAAGKFLPLRVVSKKGGVLQFLPGRFPDAALPEKFVKLENCDLISGTFPKSKHFQELQNILKELPRQRTPKMLANYIIAELERVAGAEDMNIFARAELTRKMLDVLAVTSEFYRAAITRDAAELDKIAGNYYKRWFLPTAVAEYSSAAEDLRKFFKSFKPAEMRKAHELASRVHNLSLSRGLTPGGVILRDRRNRSYLHWFEGSEVIDEFWIFSSGQDGLAPGWLALNQKDHVNKSSKHLKFRFMEVENGTVFFVPADNRNTMDLHKKVNDLLKKHAVSDIVWPSTWPINIK
ncbi:MAG: hypothetical protein IKA65_07570 [Lentisphaeria bacterium]|nr:hypothetical protein [Lentisphaeria bacterium]